MQKIIIEWSKDQIQQAYRRDAGAQELRRKKENDDNIQERKGILYWKE